MDVIKNEELLGVRMQYMRDCIYRVIDVRDTTVSLYNETLKSSVNHYPISSFRVKNWVLISKPNTQITNISIWF